MPGFETGGNDKYLADDARRWGVRSLGEHAPTEGLLPGRRLVRRQLGAEVRAKAVQLVYSWALSMLSNWFSAWSVIRLD